MNGEHEQKDTIQIDVFEPDHAARTESAIFLATKKAMKVNGLHFCSICNSEVEVEYHHRFVEWCFTNAIDWDLWRRMILNPDLVVPIRSFAGMEEENPKWEIIQVPARNTLAFRIGTIVATEQLVLDYADQPL